jgi:ComF family protein
MPTFTTLLESLLTLLFPDRCAACERPGALLCGDCRAALAPYPQDNTWLPEAISAVRIAFVFGGPLRKAVHTLKYRAGRRVAEPLGQLMGEYLGSNPVWIDALIPIPLHAGRLAERGFNQAELLARAVARTTGSALINDGIVRIRATGQQAHLDARARRENMRGAFAWQGRSAPPRRVLLVDDVLTTGATMSACAQVLREAGAEEVYGLALARSVFSSQEPGAGVKGGGGEGVKG